MQEFCSLYLDSTKDNTDKKGETVNYMFNQFIDEKDGYYCALGIIQSDHSIVLQNATFSRNVSQHQDCNSLEQSILGYLATFMKNLQKPKMKKCNKSNLKSGQNI